MKPHAMVTMQDLADQLGLSKMSISKALRNSPTISPSTKEKVRKLAKQWGYVANTGALSFRSGKTQSIGCIVKGVDYDFYPQIVRSIESTLFDNGYHLLLGISNQSLEKEKELVHHFLSRRIDGLILGTLIENDALFESHPILFEKKIPTVFLDNHTLCDQKFPIVTSDDLRGGEWIVEHLHERGHRHLGLFLGSDRPIPSRSRETGVLNALRKKKAKPFFMEPVGWGFEAGIRAADLFLEKYAPLQKVTALVANNDLVALGPIHRLKKRGIQIPREISVVGYADLQVSSISEIPLTTIRQPSSEMGTATARLILDLLQKKKWKSQSLPVELVERASTGPVPF